MSNETKQKIIYALKGKPKTRKELVNELNISRTTIFDNLLGLERLKKVERFNFNNKSRGRPIIFWKLLTNINDTINFNDLRKLNKKRELINKNFIMSIQFNQMKVNLNKDNNWIKQMKVNLNRNNLAKQIFSNQKKKKINSRIKKKISRKTVNSIKTIDSCKNCNREINSHISLIKLKDNNYYCNNCIIKNKQIFDLLTINGYWYNYYSKYRKSV